VAPSKWLINVIRVFISWFLLLLLCNAVVLSQAGSVATNQPSATATQTTADNSDGNPNVTFKAHANLVQVKVVVRDQQENPVENLEREDFQVYDRGKLQTISTFVMQTPEATESVTVALPGSDSTHGFALPRRFVALVFDDAHMSLQQSLQIRHAAQLFINGTTAADRIGIYSTSGQVTHDFTGNIDDIQHTISNIVPRPITVTNERECPNVPYSMASRIENDGDPEALDNVVHETLICAFGGDQRKMRFAQSVAQAAIHQALRVGEADIELVCRRIQDVVERLRQMPGERVIVLVSPGFLLSEQVSGEREIVEEANRANIIINTLDSRGLYVPSGDDISKRPTGGVETADYKSIDRLAAGSQQAAVLADFAAGTGGTFFHNSNDLSGGLKLAGRPSTVYILGFAPRDLKQDGRYHELKVKLVGKHKYSIQARRGYYAPLPMGHKEQEEQDIANELHSTEESGDLLADLQIDRSVQDRARSVLVLQSRVALRSAHFRKDHGKNSDVLRMITGVFDENGNMITGGEKILTMNLDDRAYRKLSASGLTVHLSFNLGPGKYLVRQVLLDSQSGETSTRSRAVEISN
jgi:VWFA-related protein